MERRDFLKALGLMAASPDTIVKAAATTKEKIKTPEELHSELMKIVRFYEDPSSLPHDDFLPEKPKTIPYWVRNAYSNLRENLNVDYICDNFVTSMNFINSNDGTVQFSKLFQASHMADADVSRVKELIAVEFQYINSLKKILKEKILEYSFKTEAELAEFVNGRIDNETMLFITRILETSENKLLESTDMFPGLANRKVIMPSDFQNPGYHPDKSRIMLDTLNAGSLESMSLGFNEQQSNYCESLKQKFFPLLDIKKTNLAEFSDNAEQIIDTAVEILNAEKKKIIESASNKEEQIEQGKILFYTFITFLVKAWEGVRGKSAGGQNFAYPTFDPDKFTDCSVYIYEVINQMFAGQISNKDIFYRGTGGPIDQIEGYSECLSVKPELKPNIKIPDRELGVYVLAVKHHMQLAYPDVERNSMQITESSVKYPFLSKDGKWHDADSGVGRNFYNYSRPISRGYLQLTDSNTIENWLEM